MRVGRLVVLTIGILLALTACQKRARVVATPPPPPATSVPPPVLTLEQADRAFSAGNYDEAARGYDDYLKLSPNGSQQDESLFRLGLTYVLRANSSADWDQAAKCLKRLVDEYPNSPLRPPANLILALRSEVDQLTLDSKTREKRIRQITTELERLKKIDAGRRR
ncbi:MAG: tetratricopeptide repeat protein [Acidobacteria bacterium]|nr:tetratricopeptide repeat protein [Acidobacteriota bacterium]